MNSLSRDLKVSISISVSIYLYRSMMSHSLLPAAVKGRGEAVVKDEAEKNDEAPQNADASPSTLVARRVELQHLRVVHGRSRQLRAPERVDDEGRVGVLEQTDVVQPDPVVRDVGLLDEEAGEEEHDGEQPRAHRLPRPTARRIYNVT